LVISHTHSTVIIINSLVTNEEILRSTCGCSPVYVHEIAAITRRTVKHTKIVVVIIMIIINVSGVEKDGRVEAECILGEGEAFEGMRNSSVVEGGDVREEFV
jgi:hypothetical protein